MYRHIDFSHKRRQATQIVMKFVVVLAALVAVAVAAPAESKNDVYIVKSDFDNIGVDGYKFNFENSDGSSRSEVAELKNAGSEQEHLAIQGVATWTDAFGKWVLEYTADDNGFHSKGATLVSK